MCYGVWLMSRSARVSWLALLVGATGSLLPLPGRVAAHAPPEVWHIAASAPSDLLLATNRGLIFADRQAGPASFTLLCNEAFGADLSTEYRAARLPSGRLLVALRNADGLRASDDRGCTWRTLPALHGAPTPFMVQDERAPDHVYIASNAVGAGGVLLSTDGAETVSTLLTVSDDDFVGSLLVSSRSPTHLYAGIVHFPPNEEFTYFVQHSADGGKSWDRQQVPLTSGEIDLVLLAANPVQPLQLVARASASEPIAGERVLFSRDGGKTFSSPLTVRALRAAKFSDDGQWLFIGGRDGVMRAAVVDGELSFASLSTATRISAFDQLDDQLLACGYYEGDQGAADGVGSASLEAADFRPWLDFAEVQTALDCPAPSTVNQQCATLFRDWQIENPPALTTPDAGRSDRGALDAGARDAASTPEDAGHVADSALFPEAGATAPPAMKPSARGCAVERAEGADALSCWSWPLLWLVAIAYRRRQRAARP
ncbi:MAG: hypothetical protein JWN48_3728 [Myxococcaceae bacterium]|nr:hypothetical protein [Myxococcaceae bacterium]